MIRDDLVKGLNPAQREAVETVKGPVLVLAGPGSGKTRVLAHRVAYLLKVADASPRQIIAVTFTNKAAGEMRDRIHALLGEAIPTSAGWRGLTIGTFHSICARILRAEAEAAGLNPNYVIYDEGEQLTAVKQALRDLKLDDKMYKPEAMRAAIGKAKNELIKPDKLGANTYWEEVARRVYTRYSEIMAANGALDFDDLLARTTWLFQDRPDVLARYHDRYTYILVDEFQDTNTAEYQLVRQLAEKNHNLFAVGDEDQSIFGFKGADYRNVARFRQDFPEARVVLLEENYRSTQTILDIANAVIERNVHRTPKRLRTDRGRGVEVTIHQAYDESDEARYVLETVQRIASKGEARLRDCAVMYRTNAQSRALEDAFVAKGIPYRLVGGTRFYQRKEVKDALAYLRLVHNPADNISLGRVINVPPRAIGDKTVQGLAAWSASLELPMTGGMALLAGDLAGHALPPGYRPTGEKPPEHPFTAAAQRSLLAFYRMYAAWLAQRDALTVAALLGRVIEQSGYATWLRDGTEEGEERWENLQELVSVAQHYDDFPPEVRLSAFLEEVALVSEQEQTDVDNDRVTLLTLHSAKGLEFPVVFIVGLEENIFPHSRSLENPNEMEEERRLMYVGVTRAKDRLFLIHAFRRVHFGRTEINQASRFLKDVVATGGARQEKTVGPGGAYSMGQDRRSSYGDAPARRSRDDDDAWELPKHRDKDAAPPQQGYKWGAPESGSGVRRAWSPGSLPPEQPKREQAPRATEFKPGDRVEHGVFGQGIVLRSEMTGGDEEVTVTFPGKGEKKLLTTYARLRKVGGS